MPRLFGRVAAASVALAPLFLLAACGPSDVGADRLEVISAGTSRDSLWTVMGEGPLGARYADTLRVERGFRRSQYLIDGVLYEVLFFRLAPGDVSEAVRRDTETPVVLRDGAVLGWGWDWYEDTAMKEYRLPDPRVATR